jgi:hypothetical protein
MKTKLLKKLRKRFSDQYFVIQTGNIYEVWYGKGPTDRSFCGSLESAKRTIKELATRDIERWVEKRKRRSIKYYPW